MLRICCYFKISSYKSKQRRTCSLCMPFRDIFFQTQLVSQEGKCTSQLQVLRNCTLVNEAQCSSLYERWCSVLYSTCICWYSCVYHLIFHFLLLLFLHIVRRQFVRKVWYGGNEEFFSLIARKLNVITDITEETSVLESSGGK